PALCADRAIVIWTRHRRPPDVTIQMRDWFAASGFDELAFDALETGSMTGVGVHRLARRVADASGHLDQPLFSFGSQQPCRDSGPTIALHGDDASVDI